MNEYMTVDCEVKKKQGKIKHFALRNKNNNSSIVSIGFILKSTFNEPSFAYYT